MTQEQNDAAALEREATRTRHEIDQTIHEIEHRLSPGQLLDQVLGTLREHGGELGKNLGGQIKENPAALILTGVGLAWLTLGQGRAAARATAGDGASESTASSVKSSMKEAASSVKGAAAASKDRYADAMHGVAETAAEGKARVQSANLHLHDSVSNLSERTRGRVRHSSQQAKDLYDEHPMLVGGLGLALGAALGAFLPRTETEDDLVGEQSDEMTAKLKTEASQRYDQVREEATRAVEEAGDSVRAT